MEHGHKFTSRIVSSLFCFVFVCFFFGGWGGGGGSFGFNSVVLTQQLPFETLDSSFLLTGLQQFR